MGNQGGRGERERELDGRNAWFGVFFSFFSPRTGGEEEGNKSVMQQSSGRQERKKSTTQKEEKRKERKTRGSKRGAQRGSR